MSKLPAFQFYPGDWRKDPGVQALSYTERGIWIELLCLMHESESPGRLLLGGKPYPSDRLARLLGLDILLMGEVISVLIDLNVASLCPETGALMNRRMVKDRELSQIRAQSGKMGGNPVFKKGQTNPYYNQKDKQADKQKITPSSSSSSSTSIKEKEDTNVSSKKPKKRKQQIPDPFLLTSSMREWAAGKTPTVDITLATENFVDHFRNKGETGLDWIAKWRTWMRNDFTDFGKFPKGKLNGANNGTNKQSSIDQRRNNARALAELDDQCVAILAGQGPEI